MQSGSFGNGASSGMGFGMDSGALDLAGNDDVSDLLYDGEMETGSSDMAEIDVDEDMDRNTRWRRMKACLTAAKRYVDSHSDDVAAAVSTLLSQAPAGQGGGPKAMAPEQLENSLVFAMILTCYQKIDDATLEIVQKGGEVPKAKAEATFGKIGEPSPRPSPSQYAMLDKAMRQEQQRMMKDADPGSVLGSTGTIIPSARRMQKMLCCQCIFLLRRSSALATLR